MKRVFALALCAVGLAAVIVACGGAADDVPSANKLTIVGSGT